jgi:uncharacterized protein (DUF2141 family)
MREEMKKFLFISILFSLLVGCGTSAPEIVDTGQPGQIKVVVFLDSNRNGRPDDDEAALQEQVGISQDISCPAQSLDDVTFKTANASGEVLFDGLQAGEYCISYHGDLLPTTKLTFQVPLSSEQVLTAYLGLVEN